MCSSGSAARSKAEQEAVQGRLWQLAHHLAGRGQACPPEGGRAAAHRCRAAGQGQAVGGGGRPLQAPSLPGGATADTRDDPGLESGRGRRDRPGLRDLLRQSLAGSNGIRSASGAAWWLARSGSSIRGWSSTATDGDTRGGKDDRGPATVAREGSTIPDALATVHDALLGGDEAIACSYGCGDFGRCNGSGRQAVYLVTGPRRCGRLPAWPPRREPPASCSRGGRTPDLVREATGGRARA
jgi:hypothetical protein